MFPFIGEAYAMGSLPQEGGAAGAAMQFLPLVLIVVIFWFLVIQPQRKRAKSHTQMLARLNKGDEVYTESGIRGTIVNKVEADQAEVTLEIAPKVQIRLLRARIADVVKESKGADKAKDGGS
jgi:preprotein translocase subunit YajC